MGASTGRGLVVLRIVLLFSLVSTTLHYTDNIVEIEKYPSVGGIPDGVSRVLIGAAWVVLGAIGLLGYRRYRQGRYWPALGLLMGYSLAGLASLGHFLVGVPRVSAFWMGTIVTDTIAAVAIWVFAGWTARVVNAGASVPGQVPVRH